MNNLIVRIKANNFFDTSKNIESEILPSSKMFKSGYKYNNTPMLAFTYDPEKKAYNSFDLKDLKLENENIAIQPKLDGIRCIAVIDELSCKLYYRTGKLIKNLEHIEIDLMNLFFKFIKKRIYNKKEITIDGELLLKNKSFNKLNGILQKDLKTIYHSKITYNIFDIIDNLIFEDRDVLKNCFLSEFIIPVKTEYIIASDLLLREKLNNYISGGFEGLMIRELGIPYENRRSCRLLKYKNWIDDEFEIIDINKEKSKNIAGSFTLKTKEGYLFNCSLSFSINKRFEFLNNKSKYIGKFVNVNFFEYSENNIPRFPVAKHFRID